MEIRFKIKNKFKKVDNIINNLPQIVQESVEDILKNMQIDAIRLERGHNESGILIEIVNVSTKEVKGRLYADPSKFISNNDSYLLYEYFGTGSHAEMEHVGTSKHFIETGYVEWYIPVRRVERDLHYPIKVINGKEFYVAKGSKPNHFLENAEFATRENNIKIIDKKIKEFLKEVCN